jgi:hypothetical protein
VLKTLACRLRNGLSIALADHSERRVDSGRFILRTEHLPVNECSIASRDLLARVRGGFHRNDSPAMRLFSWGGHLPELAEGALRGAALS